MAICIIAEIGSVHDGSFGNAKQLIRAAAECGADVVKFQTHIASAETLKNAPSPAYFTDEPRFAYFERTAFSLEQHRKLKEFAETECKVEFLSSPFSAAAIELLEKVGVRTYKVPSGEVTNLPFLIALAKTGKTIILSSGMSSWEEIDEAVAALKTNGAGEVILLQCTSAYPCPPEKAGINIMLEMKRRYGLKVGFSDHTLGIAIPIMAASLGAEVIEKHFTLSKRMYGSDAKNSAEPDEFAAMVQGIRSVETALANPINKDSQSLSLAGMKQTFEKSIVFARALPAGTVLEEGHLAFKKPGNGVSARHFREVIGKTLKRDTSEDGLFAWDLIEKA